MQHHLNLDLSVVQNNTFQPFSTSETAADEQKEVLIISGQVQQIPYYT